MEEPSESFARVTDQRKKTYASLRVLQFLKQIPLFDDVPTNYLRSLSENVEQITLASGELLFEQGDAADSMYVICSGSIGISVNGREVAVMTPGRCIGEMAVLDNSARSATCQVKDEAQLLKIPAEEFELLAKSQHHVSIAILKTLGRRIRRRQNIDNKSKSSESGVSTDSSILQADSEIQDSRIQAGSYFQSTGSSVHGAKELLLSKLLGISSFLHEVSLFANLPPKSLASIAEKIKEVRLFKGETLFKQGARGNAMYVIREGQMSIEVNGQEVSQVADRDYFGEMALIDDSA